MPGRSLRHLGPHGACQCAAHADPLRPGGNETSYRAQLDYNGDRYGLQLERLGIGDSFNPEVGFVKRLDMFRNFAQARFSPRPGGQSPIRKYFYQATADYIENGTGRLETRMATGEFALDFKNADRVGLIVTNEYEYLPVPFRIGGGLTLPVGGYEFNTARLNYNMGQQRAVSANLSVDYGTFYDGRKTTLSVARGRMPITTQLSVEPTYSYNRVRLSVGDFTTHLAGSRVTFTMTPLMFVSALVQYN